MMDELSYLYKLEKIVKTFNISLTEEKLFDLLQIKYRWRYDTIEFINQMGMTSSMLYDHDGYLNFDKFRELYDLEFPCIISNIMDISQDLRNLDQELKKTRGCLTNANLYFSKGSSINRPSFDMHSHDYHVIVKTIYGSAKWKVGVSTLVLNANDTLVIPAGTPHAVVESKNPRLSLTMNMSS